jgi:hypothetical protein
MHTIPRPNLPPINLPTSWEEVTIGQHIAIRKILKEAKNTTYKLQSILAVLSNLPLPDIRALSLAQATEAADAIAFYLSTEAIPAIPSRTYIHLGKEWEVPESIEGATFGEFVDMDTAMNEALQNTTGGGEVEAAFEAVLVYVRPVGEKYLSGMTHDQLTAHLARRREELSTLPVTAVEGLGAFFTVAGLRSEQAIQMCGAAHLEAVSQVYHTQPSQRSGAGPLSSPRWPARIWLRRMRSQIARVEKSWHGWDSRTPSTTH